MVAEQIASFIAALDVKTAQRKCFWDLLSNSPAQNNNVLVREFIREENLIADDVFCLPHRDGCVLLAHQKGGDFVFGIQQKQTMPVDNYYYGGMRKMLSKLFNDISDNIEYQYCQPDGLYAFLWDITKDVDSNEVCEALKEESEQ